MRRRWKWLCAAGLAGTLGAAACGRGDDNLGLGPDTAGDGGNAGGTTTANDGGGGAGGNDSTGGGGGAGGGGNDAGGSGGNTNTGGGGGAGGGNAATVIVDLRVDVNRNGTIDLADPTEDQGEDTWDKNHGAIFLANIDDDEKACPTSGKTDAQYAACNDAADDKINGPDDLADLARMKVVAWPLAPTDIVGTVAVTNADRVRMFKMVGGNFEPFDPATMTLTKADFETGVEFAIEAKDIVRDNAAWDGFADVKLTVTGTGPDGVPLPEPNDKVRLRVAPVLFRHHLDPARTAYASSIKSTSSLAFRKDLSAGVTFAGLPDPLYEIPVQDQWNQDYFETAYVSMPGPNGKQHVIHVNFRSANYTGNALRSAGRTVFTMLRGKDVAGAVQYDPAHSNDMDTLNSFGNLETVPPYGFNGKSYPNGRVLRGSTPEFYPDKSFDKMIESQGTQPIIYINTEWLLVGHVDETTTFVKASSPRGWALGLNDPALARKMLEDAKAAGFGSTLMFTGKFWSQNQPAEVSIDEVLADPDVMNESAKAAVEIDGQLDTLKQETGITDAEIIHIPGLHQPADGYSVAYQPGMVNGIYLSDTVFGPPKPHGPVINGKDIFEMQLIEAFAPYGISVHFIENWDLYHRLDGEVHCGSNVTRQVPDSNYWWEGGL
jgi:protein-arginine deiminase